MRGPLALDLVGGGDDRNIGDVAQGDVGAKRGLDRQFAELGDIVAYALSAPDEDVEDLLVAVDLADLQALDRILSSRLVDDSGERTTATHGGRLGSFDKISFIEACGVTW